MSVKASSEWQSNITTKNQSYQLVSLLHVGTLETGNDGGAQAHLVDDVDQSLSDGVTADNTTEDVDKDSRHLRIAGDQLESALDSSRGSTTTNIKEVGGATTVQLDNVHGGHGETSTVDYLVLARCVRVNNH